MRKTAEDQRKSLVKQEDLDRLVAQVQHQLSGRLRDFQLERLGDEVILTGRAGTYYAKQLAQHAVMRAAMLPVLRNEIRVS